MAENLNQNIDTMRQVLEKAKTIAVVGHSDKDYRTSYQIAAYLRRQGYRVIPVNPTVESIDGDKSYASLRDIDEHIDIVNVFRRSEHVAGVVEDTIAIGAETIWTQLGVIDHEALNKALQSGINIAVDLCIKVEHARLNIPAKNATG